MAFSDSFDPAGMLAYSNQIENMRLRNRLYEMQYSAQEQAEHQQAQKDKAYYDLLRQSAAAKQQENTMTVNPSMQGGATPSGGTSPTVGNPMAVGPTIANARGQSIAQSLKGLGLSGQQVAGSLGGLSMETNGFDPNAVNPKSGAFGIGQWLGTRLSGLQRYAAAQGKPINDFETQKNYLAYELQTGEKDALAAIQKAGTASDAVNAWTDKFERSDATPDLRNRGMRYANNVNAGNMVADASGRTVPSSPSGGMAPQNQAQPFPNTMVPKYLQVQQGDSDETISAKVRAADEYQKEQQFVQQRYQAEASNLIPKIGEIISQYDAAGDEAGKKRFTKEQMKAHGDNPVMMPVLQLWHDTDVSPAGAHNYIIGGKEGIVPTDAHIQMARKLGAPPEDVELLEDAKRNNMRVSAPFVNGRLKGLEVVEGKAGEAKNKTTYQRARDSLIEAGNPKPTEDEITKKANDMTTDLKTAEQEAKQQGIDIKGMAKSMGMGNLATYQATGSMSNPVKALIETEVLKEYPKYDFTKLDANAKWDSNPGNQRTQSMIQGALPRVAMLDDQVQKLGNTQIPIINRAKELTKTELGSADYTNFNSNRNAIVQEINTALSSSSQSSDMRIKIELENIKSVRSPAQLHGAINNLNEALLSRMDSTMNPRWPLEVVRGEKTVPEYTKELISKYRGKFSQQSQSPNESRSKEDFIKQAKAAGSKMSDNELGAYYDQEHGSK